MKQTSDRTSTTESRKKTAQLSQPKTLFLKEKISEIETLDENVSIFRKEFSFDFFFREDFPVNKP